VLVLRTRPWVPYLYVAPAVALLALVFAYPVAKVIDFSTRLIRGSTGPRVGTLNYELVFDDPTFRDAAKHSAMLLIAVPILLAISVIVAVVLFDRMRGWKIYRSVLFMPYILAVPIVGIVASYIFSLNGVLNSILRGLHLDGFALDWLGSERLAFWTLMAVIIWREVGFGIILFLARLLTMSEEPLEAARIDGAGWWARLRYVILPELRGTIEFYVVVASITMLAWVFAYVYTLTSGGPGTSTTILELYIYNQGLRNSLPGMASAVAVILLAATTILIGVRFWVTARARDEEVGLA
jgi:ABC-type sugar transport system permease subunit